jgi:hypothetical protein
MRLAFSIEIKARLSESAGKPTFPAGSKGVIEAIGLAADDIPPEVQF